MTKIASDTKTFDLKKTFQMFNDCESMLDYIVMLDGMIYRAEELRADGYEFKEPIKDNQVVLIKTDSNRKSETNENQKIDWME